MSQKIFILGDSYSTYEGYIPKGYPAYYPNLDCNNIKDTWWQKYIDDVNGKLIYNSSYSGATICNTGYNGEDFSKISFIGRMDELIENGFFKDKEIDTMFIVGGTNDYWANSPLGNIIYDNISKENLYEVLPAFSYLLKRVKDKCNVKKICCVINCDIGEEIPKNLKTICDYYNVDCIQLNNIDKDGGHPNKKGMAQIEKQILNYYK